MARQRALRLISVCLGVRDQRRALAGSLADLAEFTPSDAPSLQVQLIADGCGLHEANKLLRAIDALPRVEGEGDSRLPRASCGCFACASHFPSIMAASS